MVALRLRTAAAAAAVLLVLLVLLVAAAGAVHLDQLVAGQITHDFLVM
jgi:hypothetical protein